MQDFLLIAVILLVLGAAAFYVIREKKRGVKCIGCPNGGKCDRCRSDCARRNDQN